MLAMAPRSSTIASASIVILVMAMAVYMAVDPWKQSPLASVPHFVAKPVRPPVPRPGTIAFPRDEHNKLDSPSQVRFLPGIVGPESLAFDSRGAGPYTGVADGRIMRWDGPLLGWSTFATLYPNQSDACFPQSPPVANLALEHICGRPLGIHFMEQTGELYIADAYHGLRKVGPDGGEAELVAGEADGLRFSFTNDVEISADGLVYFTDSSINYQRRQFLFASLSGDDTGRLLRYDPSTKQVEVLYKGIQFPNGLAISKDEDFLVVAGTTTCRLWKFWLKGEKAGTMESFVQLPGPPDNVRVNRDGEFWVAIHCRQTLSAWLFFRYPGLMRALLSLPIPMKHLYAFFLGGKPHAMLVRYNADGELLEVLEDKEGNTVKLVSEVEERDGELWLGSVLMPYVAVYSR